MYNIIKSEQVDNEAGEKAGVSFFVRVVGDWITIRQVVSVYRYCRDDLSFFSFDGFRLLRCACCLCVKNSFALIILAFKVCM